LDNTSNRKAHLHVGYEINISLTVIEVPQFITSYLYFGLIWIISRRWIKQVENIAASGICIQKVLRKGIPKGIRE
jgi:hypothetical protein